MRKRDRHQTLDAQQHQRAVREHFAAQPGGHRVLPEVRVAFQECAQRADLDVARELDHEHREDLEGDGQRAERARAVVHFGHRGDGDRAKRHDHQDDDVEQHGGHGNRWLHVEQEGAPEKRVGVGAHHIARLIRRVHTCGNYLK